MTRHDHPTGNRLLAALPAADLQRLQSHMKRVDLLRGQVLNAPGLTPLHAYFPTSAVFSKFCMLASGGVTEVAVVGNEGMIGMSMVFGTDKSTNYSEVLVAGQAWSIGAEDIRQVFCTSAAARQVLLLYFQAFMTQVAQTAVCNRFHTIEQQVCGFLLHTLDRLDDGSVWVTHERLATLMGVRRESVTSAVGRLQDAGIVRLSRGQVEVLDKKRLEAMACECHAVVRDEYERLLPLGTRSRVEPAVTSFTRTVSAPTVDPYPRTTAARCA